MTSHYQDGQLLDLVGLLYDAVTDVNKWHGFVQSAAQVFSARIGHVLSYSAGDAVDLNFSIYCGLPPEAMLAWETWALTVPDPLNADPRNELFAQFPGRGVANFMLSDPGKYEESRFYKEVLKPHSAENFLCVWSSLTEGSFAAFGFLRGADEGPYSPDDVAAMNKLAPHFDRAIRLQQKFAAADLRSRLSIEALDRMSLGVVLLDRDANLVLANRTARQLIDTDNSLREVSGQLAVVAPEKNRELRHCLRELVDAAELGHVLPGKTLSLPRPPPMRPLSLTISPLTPLQVAMSFGMNRSALAAIFITDPDRPQESVGELCQRIYGLTSAEAEVLDQLVEGQSTDDIARKRKVYASTVRSQLKSIYSKTGTTGQSALVSLALSKKPPIRF